MPDQIDHFDADPPSPDLSAPTQTRVAIALIGIGLPFLARIPGIYYYRPDWLTSYLGGGIVGLALISGFNAINWGSILLVTCYFRSARAIAIVAAIGFALPALGHATLDLRADAQSAIAIPMFPIMALPLVGLGWLVGHFVDRRTRREGKHRVGSKPHAKCPGCSNELPDRVGSCPNCGKSSRRRSALQIHKVVGAVGAVGITLGMILMVGSFPLREISWFVVGVPFATLGFVIFALGLYLGWIDT